MIRHYLIAAVRYIFNNKIFSVITSIGLSIGMATFVLILLWVMDEMNYDKFHNNINQLICIIEKQEYSEGQNLYTNNTPFALKDELQNKYPEVLNVTRTIWIGDRPMSFEDKVFTTGPIAMVDPEFLRVFTFNILAGDSNALQDLDKIMITREIAEIFFGNVDPVGKTLKMDDQYEFEVGTVLENVPDNSTFKFKILVPFVQMEKIFGRDLNSWGNNWPRTTVLLKEGTSVELFQKKIENLCKDNGQENTTLFVKPLAKDHLYSYSGENSQVQYIYLFIAIGIIILLIASVNFVNLSTARSESRAKEVGIRKVIGAHRINLIFQFLSEKILLVFMSLIFATVIAYLLTPIFNDISGKNIIFNIFKNRSLLLLFVGAGIITILLSGIYPAVILSSFSPVRALKSMFMVKSKKQVRLRSILVIVQFTLSIILIVSAMVVLSQLQYMKNFNLGYESENLIYIELQGQAKKNHVPFSNEILKIPGVKKLTKADKPPFWSGNSSWGFDWEDKDPNVKVLINMMWVDKNYFTVLGIPFVEGSSFSDRFDNYDIDEIENLDVILNAEAIRRMKLNEPVGKYFDLGEVKSTIVGVTNDFNFESLKRTVEPLLLLPLQEDPNVFIVRIQTENIHHTIENVEQLWKEINPASPFIFGFFDDRLGQMYQSEVRISKLFEYFTAIALFIACLGLLGLSSYSIQRRTKEIGVRKVVGASVRRIVLLLSKEFTLWIFISFLVACPISWYVMNIWLQNFAYKTAIYWWIFAVAGFLALFIAIITVGFQTIHAALKNPVDSLRYE